MNAETAWSIGALDGFLLTLEKEIAHIRAITQPLRDALEEDEG